MHFLSSLYNDFQLPLCVDTKFVSIVKSDFMSNYFCRILFFVGGGITGLSLSKTVTGSAQVQNQFYTFDLGVFFTFTTCV